MISASGIATAISRGGEFLACRTEVKTASSCHVHDNWYKVWLQKSVYSTRVSRSDWKDHLVTQNYSTSEHVLVSTEPGCEQNKKIREQRIITYTFLCTLFSLCISNVFSTGTQSQQILSNMGSAALLGLPNLKQYQNPFLYIHFRRFFPPIICMKLFDIYYFMLSM